MARYRKIDVRIWSDREVRRLSRPQPNGQSLWMYLLTARETVIIPGVFASRESGLAEELGWPLDGFRKAFAEVSGQAFAEGERFGAEKALAKADWEAGLVYVPNGIKHNAPQSPNVVRSWGRTWDELPECDLKAEAYRGLRAFVEGMGHAFLKAFDEAIPRPSWKAFAKPKPNQDQEQEQEQEGDHARGSVGQSGTAQPNGSAPPTPQPAAMQTGERPSPRLISATGSISAPGADQGAGDDDDSFTRTELEPEWQLWAVWEELAGGGPGTCGDRKPFRRPLGQAYASCQARDRGDPVGLWRRMVEAFIAERRARGKQLDLAALCGLEFAAAADRVARVGPTRRREPTLEELARQSGVK